jgi:hypothetical protein
MDLMVMTVKTPRSLAHKAPRALRELAVLQVSMDLTATMAKILSSPDPRDPRGPLVSRAFKEH